MAVEPIRVEGLAEFARNLKSLDARLPKMLRLALNEVSDVIIADARPRVPKLTGRAQASMKARSTRTLVRVSAGGSRARHYPWLDFGGKVGIDGSVVRPFLREGRYLYRAYFETKRSGKLVAILEKALTAQARAAGFEVT